MKQLLVKTVAALALAVLVAPALASATDVNATVSAQVQGNSSAQGTPNYGAAATTSALSQAADVVGRKAAMVQTAADLVAALSVKLSLRLASSTATSTELDAATSSLADIGVQVADMRLQATAAMGHLNIATAASTTKATQDAELKKARADIVVARKDLDAARKDIRDIFKALGIVTQ